MLQNRKQIYYKTYNNLNNWNCITKTSIIIIISEWLQLSLINYLIIIYED